MAEIEVARTKKPTYDLLEFVSERPEEYFDLVFEHAANQMLLVSLLFFLPYLGVIVAFAMAISLAKETPGSLLQDFLVGLADLVDESTRRLDPSESATDVLMPRPRTPPPPLEPMQSAALEQTQRRWLLYWTRSRTRL